MDAEQEKATRDYEAARRTAQSALVGKPGARAESVYGEAYQRMVVLGLLPQIGLSYRSPKKYRSS